MVLPRIMQGKVPERQFCTGDTAHDDRFHADVKPDNILRVHGEFKLADFGFAKFQRRMETHQPREYIDGGTETYGTLVLRKR